MIRFIQTTQMISGVDSIKLLPEEVKKRGISKLFVVTDKGIVKSGVLEKVEAAFSGSGIVLEVFDGVEPNPTDVMITRAGEICRSKGSGGVLGIGGGSPVDAAKAVAVMAVNKGPLSTYCGAGADPWENQPLPVFAVPTTAGTGAEMSAAAMINLLSEHRKVDIFGRSIQAVVAILDPVLTVGLPPKLTASTGVDALSHALEAYVARFATPVTDMFAEKAIALVVENIRRAWADGGDLVARENMLLGSALAIPACSAGLGAVHSIAQTIGGFYNLPHGTVIAACNPEVHYYNAFAAPEKYASVAAMLGAEIEGLDIFEAAQQIKPALQRLLDDLGLNETIADMGVKESDIDVLAKNCMLDGCTPGNPRSMTEVSFRDLIGRMLKQD